MPALGRQRRLQAGDAVVELSDDALVRHVGAGALRSDRTIRLCGPLDRGPTAFRRRGCLCGRYRPGGAVELIASGDTGAAQQFQVFPGLPHGVDLLLVRRDGRDRGIDGRGA
ncbi:hypothetical protein GS908_00995 [Rhodococcus hoagii]|nr:hypothetical protein [Prescottella equi]